VMLAAAPLVDMSNPSQRYEEQYCSLAEAAIRWLEALKMGEPIVNRFCHVCYAVLKSDEPQQVFVPRTVIIRRRKTSPSLISEDAELTVDGGRGNLQNTWP